MGIIFWGVLIGCGLFVLDNEHQERLNELGDVGIDGDTADSGDDGRSQYQGTYSGPLEFTCTRVMSSSCMSFLAAFVDDQGQLIADETECVSQDIGNLSTTISDLVGTISTDDIAIGSLQIAESELAWFGRVLRSGDDRIIVGEGDDEVTIDGETLDCSLNFSLDD